MMYYNFVKVHSKLRATAFYGSVAVLIFPFLTGRARAALWVTVAILVFAIGASRIFLGVHYPLDVIAGFLAGAIIHCNSATDETI